MIKLLVLGVVLVILGLAGAVSACQRGAEGPDLLVATISGLATAAGLALIGVGGMRRGYHYKPRGEPPADMDPDKMSAPTAENVKRTIYDLPPPPGGRVDR
jgi:hypothetical protein